MVDVAVLLSIANLSLSGNGMEETLAPVPGQGNLLKKQEQKLICSVMKQTHGDRAEAAVILGISPTTLWRKMKEYGGIDGYES